MSEFRSNIRTSLHSDRQYASSDLATSRTWLQEVRQQSEFDQEVLRQQYSALMRHQRHNGRILHLASRKEESNVLSSDDEETAQMEAEAENKSTAWVHPYSRASAGSLRRILQPSGRLWSKVSTTLTCHSEHLIRRCSSFLSVPFAFNIIGCCCGLDLPCLVFACMGTS